MGDCETLSPQLQGQPWQSASMVSSLRSGCYAFAPCLPYSDSQTAMLRGALSLGDGPPDVSDMENDACCRCMTTRMQLLWMGPHSGLSGETNGLLVYAGGVPRSPPS